MSTILPPPAKTRKPAKVKTTETTSYTARQRIAIAVGSVGCFVLLLSVWHCTEALTTLTGSPVALAALLAIGIDCGMVACEMATIIGTGEAKKWGERYIVLAVALSMVLNSLASGMHAERFEWLAYGVGAIIPVLVFILGKVAGLLWKGE